MNDEDPRWLVASSYDAEHNSATLWEAGFTVIRDERESFPDEEACLRDITFQWIVARKDTAGG